MYEKVAINVRIIGYIKSDMTKKTQFSIIERETINEIIRYKGLLDNGTVCPVIKTEQGYIADDTINPMCVKCNKFKKSCTGTYNKNYNGCIYKLSFES